MNRTISIVVVAVLVIVGAYGAYRVVKHYNRVNATPATDQTQSTPTASTSGSAASPASDSATMQTAVSITQNGFEPQTLTIKAGQTVTWTNTDTSGTQHTVNSDPHPIHTAYPPLNLGPITQSQSKSLMFDKPGTYGYHDHYHPNLKGTVVVQ